MRASKKYQQIRKEEPRNSTGRGTAQTISVVRHFAGKRGAAAVSDSDDADEDYDEEETHQDDTPIYTGQEADKNGRQQVEPEEEEEEEETLKPKMMIKPITAKIVDRSSELSGVKTKPVQVQQKVMPKPSINTAPPSESSSEEEEEDSEEEESSSESDAPVLVKPTFISKAKRGQAAAGKSVVAANTKPAITDAAAAAKRKEQTLALAEHSLQHQADLEALLQQTTALDAELAKIDDTDETDAAAERAAWRLRELARLQRDREALVERERAREELETLREGTTEQQREAEAIARRQKEQEKEKAKKKATEDQSSGNYMQRYYHKGAFFQEDEFIKNRDFSGAVEDDYRDKRVLPKALQARTSGEVGLRGRSKYRSLAEEDTSRGALWDVATRGPRPRDRVAGDRDRDDKWDGRNHHRRESHKPRDSEGEEAYRRRREL
jgi:microfibrillar-associated protein 1